jgi:hypothetical protein
MESNEEETFDPVFDRKKWEIAKGIYVRLIQNSMGVCAQIKLDMRVLNEIVQEKGYDKNTIFIAALPKLKIRPNAETHICIFDAFDARSKSIYLKGNNGFTMRDNYGKGEVEVEKLKDRISQFIDKENGKERIEN